MAKAGFNLVSPPQAAMKKEGYSLPICNEGTEPLVYTVANIEAALDAAGIVSPNDPANSAQIIRVDAGVAPKGRPTLNSLTGLEVLANGATVVYTDETALPRNILAGESEFKAVCLLDENCDYIPDETVDDTNQWVIPVGSCVIFAVDVA